MTPRLGFLGTGWIGRHRMDAMLATGKVEAAAVADPSDECSTAAVALAPGAVRVDGAEGLLALALDGVVIASPSALHADQARSFLEKGVAVFCQKPLGRTAAECASVVDAARRADRLLGVDFSYRRTAAVEAVAGLVRSGVLGRVFAADLTFHNAYGPDKPWFYDPALSGGGCLIDLGVHLVDLAVWTLGTDAVRDVSATLFKTGAPLRAGEVEDYAILLFTAGETAVRVACSWGAHAGQEAVIEARFAGTEGGAAVRNVDGSFYDLEALRFDGTGATTLVVPPDEWGGRVAADWARALATGGRYDPAVESVVRVGEVLDAAYDSVGRTFGRSGTQRL